MSNARNQIVSELSRRRLLTGAAGLAGLAMVSPALAACGGDSGGTASGSGTKTIGVSLNGLVEYTKQVAQGIAKAFEGGDYEFKVVQANFDQQTEIKNLESLVSQAVSGIAILPNTIEAITNAVRTASSANIPVGLALWANEGPLDPFVKGVAKVDSVAGGGMIADFLKEKAKPGKVIVVQGVVGQGFSEKIDEGLDAGLQGTGFNVAVREQGFFDRNKAIGVVERALQAHPDATTIVSYAATMGDGIASYLKQNKIENITHVSSDCDAEQLTWLGTPYLAASRFYSAAETGVIAGTAVRNSIEGKEVPFTTDVFQTIMTKENSEQTLAEHPIAYPELESKLSGI